MIYGKISVTWPPLHIVLCYNLGWNGPISNFFSFRATKRLFISKWGRISSEIDWCWFKLVLALWYCTCFGPFISHYAIIWGENTTYPQQSMQHILGNPFRKSLVKMELWVTVAPSSSQKWNYEWQWRHLTVNPGTLIDRSAILQLSIELRVTVACFGMSVGAFPDTERVG